MTYQYFAFGLNIHACFELPELVPAEGRPDVTIRLGKVPDHLENPRKIHFRFQSGPGQFLLHIDNIAKYLVTGGREIIIDVVPGAELEAVRLFLLGSALGAILHQRKIFPLHASAIEKNGGSLLFCGVSGYGKSTTAGIFVKRGYELLADDICAVSITPDGIACIFPEYPHLKLWEDSLNQSGEDASDYHRIRHVLDKFMVPASHRFNKNPLPIKKVYILSPSNKSRINIVPLTGMAKFNALKNHTYRSKYVEGFDNEQAHFNTVARIGKTVPVALVERPRKPFLLNELADLLESDFHGV